MNELSNAVYVDGELIEDSDDASEEEDGWGFRSMDCLGLSL
ncbi:hypothetical protein NE237_010376 [Protea cynaroides]|uniref:Uncharacterized protein n=1 Tax=Protea cynaroides TaxID=273540 RepID=A0A9Q0L0F7_9MAGN|nr:hypothetical protein NE237_010376 [Protea cynaroides]